MAITKTAVDRLKYDPNGSRVQVLYDSGQVPGFGVVVSPKGRKTFVLQYRLAGSGIPKRLTIGRYGALTVDRARAIARDKLHDARRGIDPAEQRRQARLEDKRSITVADFAPIYVENARTVGNPGRKTRRPKKTWKEDERRLAKYITPALGRRRLTDITKADVVRLHTTIGKSAKFEANRVLALLSTLFASAVDMGYLPEDFARPTAKVVPFDEGDGRDRFVTPAELPALWTAIQAEPSVHVRAFFILALMLGCRRSELLSARWENVHLDRRELRLPSTKAGNTHTIPLPTEVVALFEGLPRQLGNPHVFPSAVEPGQPMRNIRRQWKRIRTESGLEDVRLHDLRRTVGSWLAASGESLHMIGKVLNHAEAETSMVYARFQKDAVRSALERHASAIFSVGSTKARA